MGAPQPEEIFERTREEGERRLSRSVAELVSTAIAAGLDIVGSPSSGTWSAACCS